MVRFAIILSLLAIVFSILIYFIPYPFPEELSYRSSVISTFTTALALMLGAIALFVTARVESSDYKAQQQIKSDIAELLATLSIILNKEALARVKQIKTLDFTNELAKIVAFSTSTTSFSIYKIIEKKNKEAGEKSEEWRLFFLYIAEITGNPNNNGIIVDRSIRLLNLLVTLNENDLKQSSEFASDLTSSIVAFEQVLESDAIVKSLRELHKRNSSQGIKQENGRDIFKEKLNYIKSQGINDPDIDLFLGVIENSTQAVEDALKNGANPAITDIALLKKYETILQNFEQ